MNFASVFCLIMDCFINIDEDDDDDDILSKKFIANVNFGLLEKGEATAHQSILFKSSSFPKFINHILIVCFMNKRRLFII